MPFVIGLLSVGGLFIGIFALIDNRIYFVFSAILFILAIVISFLISGYQVSILKSGIDHDEEAPAFEWLNNIITGIKMLIVSFVYFIIPTIIVGITVLVTNIPGQLIDITKQVAISQANATAVANGTTPLASISEAAAASLGTSIAVTVLIAGVLFVIFAFLNTMAEARLANTGELTEAVNIVEAFKDITRIGAGKVIAVIFLVTIVVTIIQAILGYLYSQAPQISILSVIVTPYLIFFTKRATGLLYYDVA